MLQAVTRESLEPGALPAAGLRVGYVLKRFPRLSETFILNEILELERQGVQVEIFSLLRPPNEPSHDLLDHLRAPVTYLCDLLGPRIETAGPNLETESLGPDLRGLLAGQEIAFAQLFPGKTAKHICRLHYNGIAVALLAQAVALDHLHAHFGSDATSVALLASRLSAIGFSFTAHARDIYHTYVDPEADARMRRLKIAEAAFVATVSGFNQRHLEELAGARHAGKIKRIYNGIDLKRFESAGGLREPALFLAVGRLIEKKGFRYLVDACRLLKTEGRRFRCMIVGEGPLREALERQISSCGLNENVILLGARPQEELVELLQTATAMVLPSVVSDSGDRDGLPTVLLEALAIGLPAISTTVSGIPEIIDHLHSGILVPSEDPGRLAKAMEQILLDPRLRERLGHEGRLKAERDFDLGTNVALLRSHFIKTVASQSSNFGDRSDEGRLRHG
jgi:glycosyltransferase involved in cell wall biosynthesis